jgi:hypothetical protein
MPRRTRLLATLATVLAATSAPLLACSSKTPDPQYAKDGDTGAAAPATQQSLSPNPSMGDTSQAARTQQPQAAGDSGAKGAPAQPAPPAGTKRP